MAENDPIRTIKIMLLGNSGVGKTSLLSKYTRNVFEEIYNVTLGFDFITIDKEIEGRKLRLQLWDTVGQERYRSLASLYYRGADACIFVFDVSTRKTFEDLDEWVNFFFEQLPEAKQNNFPAIVLGNKADLPDHEVTRDKINEWCQNHRQMNYYEVSAKSGQGIECAFACIGDMADKIIKQEEK